MIKPDEKGFFVPTFRHIEKPDSKEKHPDETKVRLRERAIIKITPWPV